MSVSGQPPAADRRAPHDDQPSRRASPAGPALPSARDRIDGPLWLLLGLAIVIGAAGIDRMERQGVPWFGAPGLVPGLLGLAMAVAGLWMTLRAWRSAVEPAEAAAPGTGRRVTLAIAACLAFGLGLVGHGLPFALATFVYLLAHILGLLRAEGGGRWPRDLGLAVAVALVASLLIPYVFEAVFLVRLP